MDLNSEDIHITLPRKVIKLIEKYARREHLNRSEFIREAILDYIKHLKMEKKEVND